MTSDRGGGFPIACIARPGGAGLIALGGAVAWLYAPVMAGLVRGWSNDADYAHGFLVLPLALWIAWEKRDRLRAAPCRPSTWGLLPLLASLVCYLAGQLGSELFLARVSLLGLIGSLVVLLYGWRHLELLAFPLGLLLLTIPIPAILFAMIAAPLQALAASLGESAIAVTGVPVLREGNILIVPGRALEVAEACSGIRSLMSLLTLALALGYFTEPRLPVRVLLAVSAVPIAVILNAARVAGTGIATYAIGPAVAEGFFHTFSGWLMFLIATALLVATQHVCSARPAAPLGAGATS